MLNNDPYNIRRPNPHRSEESNPWRPIEDMRLSDIGSTIDLIDRKRLYSGVTVAGIHYEREAETMRIFNAEPIEQLGQVCELRLVTTTADIRLTTSAEWRHHGKA